MNKKVFKVAILTIALIMGVFSAKAQEAGDMAVGGNLGISAAEGTSNFGIGAKFQYNVTKEIRGEGLFTYYLGDFSFWDLSVNAHYLFNIPNVQKLNVYPLAGLSLNGYGNGGGADIESGFWYDGQWYDTSDDEDINTISGSGTTFGLNIGGGAEYRLTDQISVNFELKYRIGFDDFNRFIPSVGISYKF